MGETHAAGAGAREPASRVRFEITGRVQGVGFRYWAQHEARRLGVRGTVRNRPDGAVEVEAAGAAERIAALRARLERGPDHAEVTSVIDLPPTDGALPPDFRITR